MQTTPVQTISQVLQITAPILRAKQVQRAYLFGSFSRGDQKEESDVDVLVDFLPEADKTFSIMDVMELQMELEQALGRNVDLIQNKLLLPLVRPSVDASKILIFDDTAYYLV